MVFLRFDMLYLFKITCCPYTAQVLLCADSQAKPYGGECGMYKTWNSRMVCMAVMHVFLASCISII